MSTVSKPPQPQMPAIQKLVALLRQLIRVYTTEGRVFIGTFAGTDKALNIILVSTEEYRIDDTESGGRYMSLVMVPWRLVSKVEVPIRWVQQLEGEQPHPSFSSSLMYL